MFSNILGKNKDETNDEELIVKISKMNLTDMKTYIKSADVSETGLAEIVKKLITINNETSKRYIEAGDMDSKIKKGFDLVLDILKHKKITLLSVELIQEFIEIYSGIIAKYDMDHKQIYDSRLKDTIGIALGNIEVKSKLKMKMKIIGI